MIDFTCETFSGVRYFKLIAGSQVLLLVLCLEDFLLFSLMDYLESKVF